MIIVPFLKVVYPLKYPTNACPSNGPIKACDIIPALLPGVVPEIKDKLDRCNSACMAIYCQGHGNSIMNILKITKLD